VPAGVLEELPGVRVSSRSDESLLRGVLLDQSALLGVVNRLHRSGIDLREIRPSGSGEHTPAPNQHVETVLRGPVQDRAALIKILGRLQGWGIDLRGLRQLDPGDTPAGTGAIGQVRDGGGVASYEIRVAGDIGPVAASSLREFEITLVPAVDGAQHHGLQTSTQS